MWLKFRTLEARRTTGGGGGGGSKGGGGGGSKGGGVSAGKTGVSFSGSSRGASSASAGGGLPLSIPAGSTFAGRFQGGGQRNAVFGGQRYGQNYAYAQGQRPGSFVSGRGFPFGFWPMFAFAGAGGVGGYYYGNHEYGPADNSSRPGGPMTQATLTLSTWEGQTDPNNPNATAPYWILGDYDSVVAISDYLQQNCSATVAEAVPLVNGTDAIRPEQVVEFYRDSSFALALQSYNNPANSFANMPASNDSELTTLPDVPIPAGTNLTFLDCLNQTIGLNVPIMDASSAFISRASVPLVSQLALMWVLLSMLGIA